MGWLCLCMQMGTAGPAGGQSDGGVASSFEFSPYLERMAGKSPGQGHVLVAVTEGARSSGFSSTSLHADGTAFLGYVLRDCV